MFLYRKKKEKKESVIRVTYDEIRLVEFSKHLVEQSQNFFLQSYDCSSLMRVIYLFICISSAGQKQDLFHLILIEPVRIDDERN